MERQILLVDDEPGILKVLGISLADRGYRVLTAQNGEEALRICGGEPPSIVLTDIKMPGMDGIELLRRLKAHSPDIEVIMITGHGDMDLAIRSLKHEASDFITKPIGEEALDIALRRAEERITLRRRLKEHTEHLEKLVEEKTRQLLEAERMAAIGQTVAALAHAIKNITSGLTGGMYVVEKGMELDDKAYLNQGWTMVKGNVARIKQMALDLLRYAKEREPEYQWIDPDHPARQVFELMRSKAGEQGIELKAELNGCLPKALLDPEGIHCVLLNLVTNAMDSCQDLSCTNRNPEVILRSLKPPGWAVEYQVVDNGCGMDEETKQKIFRAFFSSKGSKGTGLGLMIARKIVDEHGGRIAFSSEQAKGTLFTVRLPEK
jgi:signal transduction histidine kinase